MFKGKGRHRRPKRPKFQILWGWYPTKRNRVWTNYRATYLPLWQDGEETQEVQMEEAAK